MLGLSLALCAATTTIDLAPAPKTVLLIRMSPRSLANPPSSDRLFRLAERAIGGKGRITLLSAEQAGVDETRLADCELDRRLSCWVSEVRGVSDHLLVLSMLEAQEDELEVTGFLIDLARAQELSENEIFERAARARKTLRMEDDAEVAAYFAELLAKLLLPEPSGSIELESDGAVVVSIDGTVVGTAPAGTTLLTGVSRGSHRVSWSDPEKGPIDALSIDVGDGTVARIRISAAPPPAENTLRQATIWAGIAVAVAGAAITSAAIGLAPRAESVEPCVGAGCMTSRDRHFYAPGGVLLAPLGYSVMAAGGTASLGAALLPEGDLWVYLSLAAGVLLGGASYGLSALLDR